MACHSMLKSNKTHRPRLRCRQLHRCWVKSKVRANTSTINGVRGCSAGRNERAAGAVGSGAASDWSHCAHRRAPPLHSPGVQSKKIFSADPDIASCQC